MQVIVARAEGGLEGLRMIDATVLERPPAVENPDLASRAIGIVDDDAAIRDSLKFLLGARGIDAKCYASAAEFLRNADADDLGGLLIDQHMPDMTGIELVELLRSRRIGTPAIMLTGGSDPLLAARAKKAGVLTVLHKPFAGMELLGWINLAFTTRAQVEAGPPQ
jgi:FixJ family two-component response regulator